MYAGTINGRLDALSRRISFFGGGLGSGNLGVSALTISLLGQLRAEGVGDIGIFDHSDGAGSIELPWAGSAWTARRFGARWSRRYYRLDTMATVSVLAKAGGLFSGAARWLAQSDAVLDISGGDSVTDMYGQWRYGYVMASKRLALALRKPLILPPQTYGPFRTVEARREAEQCVRGAAMAWARDDRSFVVLRGLLGDCFDPARHMCGVDVAFLLPQRDGSGLVPRLDPSEPRIGLNVSGLIWNRPDHARERYGLRADYRRAVVTLVERLAQAGAGRVVLVPHVCTSPGHFESDRDACVGVLDGLKPATRERVIVAEDTADPCEVKGLIASCAWFCGTRMHSTIAGLSCGVPTATIAYSDKALGVFDTCGQGEHVHDPRRQDTEALVEGVMKSFEGRRRAAESLRAQLPAVLSRARDQARILAACVLEKQASS
jgi:polysaccharide pyruvyl transferase WcaK-like protein